MINHGEHGEHGEKSWQDCPDAIITSVLDAAFEVHRELGPGLLESVYEQAMAFELADKGVAFERQVDVAASYKGRGLGLAGQSHLEPESTAKSQRGKENAKKTKGLKFLAVLCATFFLYFAPLR